MNGAKLPLRARYVEASGRPAHPPHTIPNAFATGQSSNILDRYGIGQINIIFVSGNHLVKHGWHKYFGKKQHIKIAETMWQEEDNKLKKTFSFKDFRAAFAFMNKVADVVNEMDHHPYWTNMYNKVSFELNTHDAGDTVTEKDHQLAAAIDRIYNA